MVTESSEEEEIKSDSDMHVDDYATVAIHGFVHKALEVG
jgi:hypothetical protein